MLKIRHEPQDVARPKRPLGPGFGFASRQQKPGENRGDLKLGVLSGRLWASDVLSSQFSANPLIAGPSSGGGAKLVQNYHSIFPPVKKEFSSYLSTWVTLLSWGARLTLRTLRGDKGRAEGRKGESGAGASSGTAAPALSPHLCTLSILPPGTKSSWERETASLPGGIGRGEVISGHTRFPAWTCSPRGLSRALTLPGCAQALLQGVHFLQLIQKMRHIKTFFFFPHSVKLLYFDVH